MWIHCVYLVGALWVISSIGFKLLRVFMSHNRSSTGYYDTSSIRADGRSKQVSLVATKMSTTESSSACSMSRHNVVKTATRDLSWRPTAAWAVPNTSSGLAVRRCQQRTSVVNCSTALTDGTEQSSRHDTISNSLTDLRVSWRTRPPSHSDTSSSTLT